MNYITTNVRLFADDYYRLKHEAAQKRASFSSVLRDKLAITGHKKRTKAQVARIMVRLREIGQENAKYTKNFNSLEALRQIRAEN